MQFKKLMSKLILCATIVSCTPVASLKAGYFFQNNTAEAAAWGLIATSIVFCCKDKYDAKKHGELKKVSFSDIKEEMLTALQNSDFKKFAEIVNEYGIGREDGNGLGAYIHGWWKKLQGPTLLIGILAALGKSDWAGACKAGKVEGLAHFVPVMPKTAGNA